MIMKHTLRITVLLVLLFLIAHFLGLIILNEYTTEQLPLGLEPPEIEETTSFIPVFVGIIIATLFMLLIVKLRSMAFWKFWFFIPVFNLFSISALLILISVYDYISVFKTKHMVKLAKFQTEGKIFTGLFIPYKNKTAILGGGDIGFTLLFSGVIMKDMGLIAAAIVSIVVAVSLFGLLYYGKKNKFYPAMPPLTVGCFVGLLIVKLLL